MCIRDRFSCTAASTLISSTVTAEDGYDYAKALELSLYFYDANQCMEERTLMVGTGVLQKMEQEKILLKCLH